MARKRKPSNPNGGPPVVTADTPLSDDEQMFINEWIVDRNNTAAYLRCYPHASYQSSMRLGNLMRRRINVDAEIEAYLRAQKIRGTVRADEVMKELQRVAFSDILEIFDPTTNELRHPRHVPYDVRKVIKSMRVSRERRTVTTRGRTRTTVTNQIVEYQLWDKMAALTKLMRHLGLEGAMEPLEALLAALPRTLAEEVRRALADQMKPHTNGSTSGTNGKH